MQTPTSRRDRRGLWGRQIYSFFTFSTVYFSSFDGWNQKQGKVEKVEQVNK